MEDKNELVDVPSNADVIAYLRQSTHTDMEMSLCDRLERADKQIAKMEADQCSVTKLIQGRINLLDTEKDAEIARLKELVRFCWQLDDENYHLLSDSRKADILSIVRELEDRRD